MAYYPRCFFCDGPITSKDFIELYSQSGEKFFYPAGYNAVAIYTHDGCGPDCGYAIEIARLVNIERLHGWIDQIRQKRWCSPIYIDAIRDAALRNK